MTKHDDKFSQLRERAEKLLVPSDVSLISDSISHSITEIRNTIHELYTHRIEGISKNCFFHNADECK
jgi:hypothetical protein